MTYANPTQVAVELGRSAFTESAEIEQVNQWLARVERDIRRRIPDLDHRVTSGLLDRETVIDVEVTVVARKAINPEGLRSVSRTRSWDDYSQTDQETRDQELSAGDLKLTAADWERLIPESSTVAFTIRAHGKPDPWV